MSTPPPRNFTNPSLPFASEASNPVSRILECIRSIRNGHHDPAIQSWTRFELLPEDFKHLVALLKRDKPLWGFVEDKVRYDYFPGKNLFVLRMASFTQEGSCASLVKNIQKKLDSISADDDISDFIQHLTPGGSPKLFFAGEYGNHCPDAIFRHTKTQWPGIVIEVSFSQKEKDLPALAKAYIRGSEGNINVMIGFEIEYQKSKKASLSIWRSQFTEENGQTILKCVQTVSSQEIRDELGNPTVDSTSGLELGLEDFASGSPINVPNIQDYRIFIPAMELSNFITEAEAAEKQLIDKTGAKYKHTSEILIEKTPKKKRTLKTVKSVTSNVTGRSIFGLTTRSVVDSSGEIEEGDEIDSEDEVDRANKLAIPRGQQFAVVIPKHSN